jgi:hypothetical protein
MDSGSPTARAAADSTGGRVMTWLHLAAEPAVVRRGLAYAVVVGAILVAINHGDALLAGHMDLGRWLRAALTVIVPYCVSTASSVAARLDAGPQRGPAAAREPDRSLHDADLKGDSA